MIWWEKTVEYKFVTQMAKYGKRFLAPLDGNHEKAGDAITGLPGGSSWLVIEFKRCKESIGDEADKFVPNVYNKLKADFKGPSQHTCHRIIYGVGKDAKSDIGLFSCAYWSNGEEQDLEIDESNNKGLKELLNKGVDLNEFDEYITWLVEQKKTSGNGKGGNLRADDYALVAGVSKHDGSIVTCLTLTEFQNRNGLAPISAPTVESGPSSDLSPS